MEMDASSHFLGVGAKTGVRLNDRSAVVHDGDVYHKECGIPLFSPRSLCVLRCVRCRAHTDAYRPHSHVPKLKHTVVVDNPEANRLKKQVRTSTHRQ